MSKSTYDPERSDELNPWVLFGRRIQQGIGEFIHMEVSSSLVLLLATITAMILANSPLADRYFALWEIKVGIKWGDLVFFESLYHWINDFLMAVFFFVVGLEIKREVIIGELSSLRKASLPIIAAIGGMAIPAIIYALFNFNGPAEDGWGIPMATDIAFALGVVSLLGKRVPVSLKIFLAALAIGDDIGAILVIALFYTGQISVFWIEIAAVLMLLHLFLNFVKFPYPIFYVLIIFAVWFAIFESGVHATVAGILMAFAVPARPRKMPLEFISWSRSQLRRIEEGHDPDAHYLNQREQQEAAAAMQLACYDAQSTLLRLERALHPLTSFIILPLFALANAGVQISGGYFTQMLAAPVGLGIMLGLVVGKQVGITLFTFLAVKLGLADLPKGVTWKHIYGVSWLAGIGFTMSMFIGGLAFAHDSDMLDQAKLAVLTASLLAGIGGYLFLYLAGKARE